MWGTNIEILEDTLQILNQGRYTVEGRTVHLKLTQKEMEDCHVFLPQNIKSICECIDIEKFCDEGKCIYNCEKIDSFSAARHRYTDSNNIIQADSKPILVLNFANSVNPGGGVRHGARAQEEGLCRQSSLLMSLESRAALTYYEYNRRLHTNMGSDAIILTPKVEIIRDENGKLLDETVIVAVFTCAAPMIIHGKEGMNETEYQNMVYNRILGMLKCAIYFGYKDLVLGAWGCGAFGNDAHVISDLFYKAMKGLEFSGSDRKNYFHWIDFAVLSHDKEQYNFKEFYRKFVTLNQ